MNQRGSEQKDVSDPTYSAADFKVQLAGGKLRWFATILAIASISLLLDMLRAPDKAEFFYPFHAKGPVALWTVGIAFVAWATIAAINWRSWIVKRKRGSSPEQ